MLCAEKFPFSESRPNAQTTERGITVDVFSCYPCSTHASRNVLRVQVDVLLPPCLRRSTCSLDSGLMARASLLSYLRSKKPKPDKALKASATSAKARLSHGPCGTHTSGQGDLLPPMVLFLSLAWRSVCVTCTCGRLPGKLILSILSRIAGAGELFSSDFQACA